MARRTEGVTIAFVDTILNVAVGFLALFVIAFLLVTPKKEQADAGKINPKAEFIITMDWDNDSVDDMDLWIRDANGKYVGYPNRESPIAFLDKDDLGYANDTIINESGQEQRVTINQEVMTLRAIVPGRYIVNAHMYNRIANDTKPINVSINLTKINPFRSVATIKHTFENKGEEYTFLSFTVTAAGDIVNVDYTSQELFIQKAKTQ